MSEMVERVARALRPSAWGDNPHGHVSPAAQKFALEDARRAIAAMREPTDKMIEASLDDAWTAHTRGLYQRMIDAALK